MLRPWGGMDPNSRHQLWSRWTFKIWGKPIPIGEVRTNVARWLKTGFGSAGQARISESLENGRVAVVIEADIEGVPAHDPSYVRQVRKALRGFVEKGWGVTAYSTVDVKIMAGDQQDGKPADQLIVLPQRIEADA